MRNQVLALLGELGKNLRDLLPIIGVVVAFQALVIGEPMPDMERRMAGAASVLIGMTLFVKGLETSIFPLGEVIADTLARRGSLVLLIAFGFALGFGSTVAEPALKAVTDQAAAAIASGGAAADEAGNIARFSLFLRYTVSFAVGIAIAFGVLRVVNGWSVAWFVLPGYALATVLALASQSPLSMVAFDAGAAATSAINVPLMLAFGVGLASMIRGRNPLLDGFGLVALASLTPMIVITLVNLLYMT